jgi:protein involved in polysaccharide export with SLBB domain
MVEVSGDIRHPGRYYLPVGADLCSIYKAFGGWGGRSEFNAAPKNVRLTRESGRERTETKYEIRKMTEQEKQAVLLKDGDRLYYPTVLF